MNKLLLIIYLFPKICFSDDYVLFKSGYDKPFYILPVAHVQVSQIDIGRMKLALKKEINIEPKICVESAKKIPENEIDKVQKLIFSKTESISQYVDFNNYLILAKYLNISNEMIDVVYKGYTPYFLYELVKKKYMSQKYGLSMPMDDELIDQNLVDVVYGLQSASEISELIYSSLLNKAAWRNILKNQINLIKCNVCIERNIDLLNKVFVLAFKNSNLELAKYYYKEILKSSEGLFMTELLAGDGRNKVLSKRIMDFYKDNKCNIFLIGVAHFGGEDGIERNFPNIKKVSIRY